MCEDRRYMGHLCTFLQVCYEPKTTLKKKIKFKKLEKKLCVQ